MAKVLSFIIIITSACHDSSKAASTAMTHPKQLRQPWACERSFGKRGIVCAQDRPK